MKKHDVNVTLHEIEKELKYKTETMIKYLIQYPKFTSREYQPFITNLNIFYQRKANALVEYCEKKLFISAVELYTDLTSRGINFNAYEFVNICKVTYNQDCVLSLFFDQYLYEGGANGSTFRNADNWNISSGIEFNLADLFPNNKEDYMNKIEEEINLRITKQLKNNPSAYFENYSQLTKQYFDPKNFYLTSYSLNIFFQEITIAPHSSGIVIFEFPYKENKAPAFC